MFGDCTEFIVRGIEIVHDRRPNGGCRIGARFRSLYRPGFGSSPSIVACEFPDIDAQVTIMYTQNVMPAKHFTHLVEEIQTMVALLSNPHIVLTGQFRSDGAQIDCAWMDISDACHGYQVLQDIAMIAKKRTGHSCGMTWMHPTFSLVLRTNMGTTPHTGETSVAVAPRLATHQGFDSRRSQCYD